MHGGAPPMWEMLYGCDGESVAVRLDGAHAGLKIEVEFETGMVLRATSR